MAIEDRMLSEIKASMPYVRTCETYSPKLEGDLEKVIINYPAVFVIYGGSEFEKLDNINHNEACSFRVAVAAKNLRGHEAAKEDAATGCYRLIKDVLNCLTNNNLGLDVAPLRPVGISLLLITQTVVVYGLEFSTNFDNTFADTAA